MLLVVALRNIPLKINPQSCVILLAHKLFLSYWIILNFGIVYNLVLPCYVQIFRTLCVYFRLQQMVRFLCQTIHTNISFFFYRTMIGYSMILAIGSLRYFIKSFWKNKFISCITYNILVLIVYNIALHHIIESKKHFIFKMMGYDKCHEHQGHILEWNVVIQWR